ncbi:MAG: hypothetical protein WD941_08000 [Opitutus sp.]
MLTLLATATTTVDRLREISLGFWATIGGAILVLVVVVLALRKLAGMNRVVVGVVTFVVVTVFGFNWVYERNEPGWATPAVSFLADFLPSKGHLARG